MKIEQMSPKKKSLQKLNFNTNVYFLFPGMFQNISPNYYNQNEIREYITIKAKS